MDQLKIFWAGVVRFHFWILTSLVLVASTITFYLSRSALDEKVTSRISKLEDDMRSVSTLTMNAPKHPNALSDIEMDKMLSEVTNNVKDAWTKQYERQKVLLKWNRKAIVSDEAHDKLDKYRPIELFLDFPLPPDKELSLNYREGYRNYIKAVFPDLAKIIGARWTAQLGSAAVVTTDSSDPSSGDNAESAASGTVVHWNDQSNLQQAIIPWYNPSSSPTTLEICYTQEDIWILQGVLRVIQATNGKVKENFQASIKEVEWIRIGKTAGGSEALLTPAGAPGNDGMAMTTTGLDSRDPADNRYVDSNYRPVPSSKLRPAMKSSNPEDAFFAVAKRVPVRFRLKMDQLKIPKLLAECGNADLMIEVKQVRVNPTGGVGISIGGGGMDSGGSADLNPGGGGGGFGNPMAAPQAAASTTSASATKPDPPVEVYGIVYLFNPVDFSKLGLEKITGNTALGTTASPAVAPAVAPAAPTPVVAPPVDALPPDPNTPAVPNTPVPPASGPES